MNIKIVSVNFYTYSYKEREMKIQTKMHSVFCCYHLIGLSQNTFSSVRCCCRGRSTCGIWVWVTSWRERRRHTCVTWPWTALIRSCRCWSPCRGPCCWSSGTSTPSAASTSLWELQSTATSSWPSGTTSPLIQISVDLCLKYRWITSASFEYLFGFCPSVERKCVCFSAVRGWGRAQADDTRMLSRLSVFLWVCSFWESVKFEFALRWWH